MKTENKKQEQKVQRKTRKHHGWFWFFVILLAVGAGVWLLYDTGRISFDSVKSYFVSDKVEVVEQVAEVQPSVQENVEVQEETKYVEIKPACKVVEEILLQDIVDDNMPSVDAQLSSAHIYEVLSERGCPENSTFFEDMAMRKKMIASGLEAAYKIETPEKASADYLYSDKNICQTIEKRVGQNINPDAYTYKEFLENAKTYSVLYEYGCCDKKAAYIRAAIRELGVAVALMPTDKMTRDEIVTVVEICKSLGVADAAHLMLQRLKARGYDREFLLEMENIIHSIR